MTKQRSSKVFLQAASTLSPACSVFHSFEAMKISSLHMAMVMVVMEVIIMIEVMINIRQSFPWVADQIPKPELEKHFIPFR